MEKTTTNSKIGDRAQDAALALNSTSQNPANSINPPANQNEAEAAGGSKIKTRQGSGYLKQLYSTARTTAGTTHSHLKNLTTFLVNFIPVEKVDASELQVRVHFDDSEVA